MAEYIESEALLNHLKHRVAPMSDGEQLIKGVNLALEILEEAVAMLPAADVAPVVHGHWVDKWKCSACGEISYEEAKSDETDPNCYYVLSDYCPNCGAKMDGEV